MPDKTIEITKDLLASKNKRFVNFLVDQIPYYILIYGLVYLSFFIGEITGNYALNDYLAKLSELEELAINFGFYVLYFYTMEVFTQRTLGKYVTQTMVILESGEKPSEKDILIRSLCRLIPFEALSFLGDDGRGWHDSISNTYVVDEKKYNAARRTETELELIGKPVDD